MQHQQRQQQQQQQQPQRTTTSKLHPGVSLTKSLNKIYQIINNIAVMPPADGSIVPPPPQFCDCTNTTTAARGVRIVGAVPKIHRHSVVPR